MKKVRHSSSEPRLYSVKDLSKVTGASVHQIGHWVRRGILPRTMPAGPYTAYTEEHRLLLLAFLGLRARGWDLRGASRELHVAPDSRIRQVAAEYLGVAPEEVAPHAGKVGAPDVTVVSEPVTVASEPAAPHESQGANEVAAAAHAVSAQAVATNVTESASPGYEVVSAQASRHDRANEALASGPYRESAARSRELWEHIEICPGVFVGVRSDADTEARRVADEIQRMFGGRELRSVTGVG